jgi:Protein of unknown function (DUF2569)
MSAICSKCAAPLDDRSYTCGQCGTSLFESFESVPTPGAPTFSTPSDVQSIGGWLIFVAIGLGISSLHSIYGIYGPLHVLYGNQFQERLSDYPGLADLLLFEAVSNTIFLIALVALNYLFYNKKKEFPGLMIAFYALNLLVILVDHGVALHFHPDSSPAKLLGSIVGAAIWIPYYLWSDRVKATFVR